MTARDVTGFYAFLTIPAAICRKCPGFGPESAPRSAFLSAFVVRPEKWDHSQVGFRGSNASGGRIVLLPEAFWAHSASKMAILGASLLLSTVFQNLGGMLPPGACRTSSASAKRIVSCRGVCVSSLYPHIPHVPAPTFGGFRFWAPG